MTIIEKITRLRHPGVLRDFNWPNDLLPFGRYNLIYGWNGTGKTTISNMFRALQLRQQPEGDVILGISGNAVSGNAFAQSTVPVRVFNREFVQTNVFPYGGGKDLPPIFVLGQENTEKQEKVETLKSEQANANIELGSLRTQSAALDKNFDKHCIDRATLIRDTLKSAGNNPYNNYDKARYRTRASTILAAGDVASHLLSEQVRDRLLTQTRATPKSAVAEINFRFPDARKLIDEAVGLAARSVVSTALSALKANPKLSAWALQGLNLHNHMGEEICLFCEQPMPAGRISALEGHFSAEFDRLLRDLDGMISKLDSFRRTCEQVTLPNKAEFYDDLVGEFATAADEFENRRLEFLEFLSVLNGALSQKKDRAFDSVALVVSDPGSELRSTQVINEIIGRHNATSADLGGIVSSAREKIELDTVASSLAEFQELKDAAATADAKISKVSTDVQTLNGQIIQLERSIVEHREPADQLNEDLRNYLGHGELQLDVKETGYTISRNGVVATALSEGEMTAIALLYFLKSLNDRSFDLGKGVVVLDDPVSSLDANALFMAFSFMQQCIGDVAQVFVLTHNFAMFRQYKNWFHNVQGQKTRDPAKKPARFYMLECAAITGGRRSRLVRLDPLLEEYDSEYHYLFARVYRRAQEQGAGGLEASYIFPNMARRLLETFLAFRRPQQAGELRKKLQELDFDPIKKQRILRFMHTQSHADGVFDPEHDPTALGETGEVLKNLLELIQHEDSRHYDAMVQTVSPPAEAIAD